MVRKTSSEQQLSGQKRLVNERGQRRRARLVEADRKVTVRQITTQQWYAQHVKPLKQIGDSSRRTISLKVKSNKVLTECMCNWKLRTQHCYESDRLLCFKHFVVLSCGLWQFNITLPVYVNSPGTGTVCFLDECWTVASVHDWSDNNRGLRLIGGNFPSCLVFFFLLFFSRWGGLLLGRLRKWCHGISCYVTERSSMLLQHNSPHSALPALVPSTCCLVQLTSLWEQIKCKCRYIQFIALFFKCTVFKINAFYMINVIRLLILCIYGAYTHNRLQTQYRYSWMISVFVFVFNKWVHL